MSPLRVALSARLSPYENLSESTDHRGTGSIVPSVASPRPQRCGQRPAD